MKHGANRRSVSSKTFVVMLALVLVLGCAVGGTIAWLTAQTPEVKNTFTYGKINIELTETVPANQQAKIIPGTDIPKNPTVTVKPGSEACWLFVKVEETGDFVEGKVTYAVDTANWMLVPGETNVYYHEVDAAKALAGVTFNVLKDNKVTVSENLTKAEINAIAEANKTPTLTFTAYAVQKENVADAATAWNLVKPATPVVPGA